MNKYTDLRWGRKLLSGTSGTPLSAESVDGAPEGWPVVSPERYAGTPSRRFTEADLAGEWEIIRVQEPRYERQLEAGQILPASIY